MKVGLTFNLRSAAASGGRPDVALTPSPSLSNPGGSATAVSPAIFTHDDEEEEFDSPETIEALAAVIRGLGHEVELIGDAVALARRLTSGPLPDFVFNIAEGRGEGRSREAYVPAILEAFGVPYSGSDPLTLAVALDKDYAKRIVRAAGVPVADWVQVIGGDLGPVASDLAKLPWPRIIKPAFEGSSKGIRNASLVKNADEQAAIVADMASRYQQPLLIEEFIDGDELTVGVVGNRPPEVIGIMRVVPRNHTGPFVYSLEVKRDWEQQVRYECPAQLSPADSAAVARIALLAWHALGCRDVSRIDFRLRQGVPYFLEVNPLPGLSPKTGDLVLLSGYQGLTYPELVGKIFAAAVERNAGE